MVKFASVYNTERYVALKQLRDEKYNQSGPTLGFEVSTVELGTPVNPNGTLKIEPVDTQAEFTKRPTFTKRAFTK